MEGRDRLGSIPSSSPPPPNLASPSKPGMSNGLGHGRSLSGLKAQEDGEQGDANGSAMPEIREEEEEEEDEGGFDLARYVHLRSFSIILLHANNGDRGFQPIGSYHRQLSNAARASAATS